MVTAASTANLAIILIDARKGRAHPDPPPQLPGQAGGHPHVVVAVNKMDLVDYDQATYDASSRIQGLRRPDRPDRRPLHPAVGLNGDMIVDRGERLGWYDGPTLIDILENAPRRPHRKGPFRFPVQYVCRPQASDDRRCTTTVASWAASRPARSTSATA